MIMVLALHTGVFASYLPNVICKRLIYCLFSIAVPLFFMVSGYLLARKELNWSYSKHKIKGILRFVFLTTTIFWIWNFAYDIIVYGHCTSPFYRLYIFFYWVIQAGINWHYWYFASMIMIYLLCPWLSRIIHSKNNKNYICFLMAICFVFFLLEYLYPFERNYIPQSFRIWYWILYFLIGSYICLNPKLFKLITWPIALGVGLCYALYQLWDPMNIGYGFHFGSISCIIYTIVIFAACLNTRLDANNRFITNISSLFLPVYSLHPFLFKAYDYSCKIILSPLEPNVRCLMSLLIYITITIFICWGLMKLPYMDKLFKI